MSSIYFIISATILLMTIAQLSLKKGMLLLGDFQLSAGNFLNLVIKTFTNIYLLVGLVSFGLAFFFYLMILSKIQLNIAYPVITAINFCLVVIASWLIFKESLAPIQIFGIATVIFGIFLIAK